jgi:hypothetical protein
LYIVCQMDTMLLLLDLFRDIKSALLLLEFHLNTPELPMNVSNPFVKRLIDAGILTVKGFLNPELPAMFSKLLAILDHPELYGAIPKEGGGDVLKFLKDLEPDDATKFKEIICRVAAEAPATGDHTKNIDNSARHTAVRSEYAVKVANLLETRPLDDNWIYPDGSHSVRPERLVYKLKKDLATRKVIEKLPPKDASAARWRIYQGILENNAFEPSATMLRQAGLEVGAVPALRAHHTRRKGLFLIPSQFILHIGKNVLRVAVFSTLNQFNESAFQQLRVYIQKLARPAEVRLSTGKTFQLDVEIKDPTELMPEALEYEIRAAWGKIRSVLEKI